MDEVGAFGWGGAYGTTYRVDPQSNMVLLLMMQHFGAAAGDVQRAFAATVYQALIEP
jgi:CubicO group peptidase (beta-lactamase class C family)